MVPSYVFPEMKLLFPKLNYNVMSPCSYTHIFVRDLYISSIGLPILLQESRYVDRSWEYVNRLQTVHIHFISVCYVSGTKRIGIKRIAA
jgi:hypothetical protein